jgi:hypothetical protein
VGPGEILLAFEVLLSVVRDAAGEAAAYNRVGYIERGFKAGAFGGEMKDTIAEVDNALRRGAGVDDAQIIRKDRLVAHRIVAVGRRQPLPWRRRGDVLLAIVGEKIADVQKAAVAEVLGDFPNRLVVVVAFQHGIELLGLESKLLFHLVDAGSAGAHAAGIVEAA